MKYILLIFIMLPLCAGAQKFDIAVSGGSNTTFMMRSPIAYAYKRKPVTTPIGAVTATFLRNRTAIGFSFRAYAMEGITVSTKPAYYNYYGIYTGDYTYHEYFGSPAMELNLLIASNYELGNATILAGGQIGVLMNNEGSMANNNDRNITHQGSTGVGVGLYFNYIYYFGAIGLGVEVSPKVSMFNNGKWSNFMTAFTLPVMAGVHMRI